MRAMVLKEAGKPLELEERPIPKPGHGEVLLKVASCGVCRTDLHVVDGDLRRPKLPLILGHEVVGRIEALGRGVESFCEGMRVGVPWLGWTCGSCKFCTIHMENLCDSARFTGYTLDGGYAEYTVAHAHYCFPIADGIPDDEAAPLLCAGLIGYRSLMMAGEAENLGIYGFGAAAH
ncbi:MAG: alcohol dehydrogenase catalytic domain-containing protein, partial [Kiloniellales bacterium]|nr:alcohol dehydrogenase catalytic domain-containing protein [Kiloniellales bacterium]